MSNASEDEVLFERIGEHVALITLNRPSARNAVNGAVALTIERFTKQQRAIWRQDELFPARYRMYKSHTARKYLIATRLNTRCDIIYRELAIERRHSIAGLPGNITNLRGIERITRAKMRRMTEQFGHFALPGTISHTGGRSLNNKRQRWSRERSRNCSRRRAHDHRNR